MLDVERKDWASCVHRNCSTYPKCFPLVKNRFHSFLSLVLPCPTLRSKKKKEHMGFGCGLWFVVIFHCIFFVAVTENSWDAGDYQGLCVLSTPSCCFHRRHSSGPCDPPSGGPQAVPYHPFLSYALQFLSRLVAS